MKNLNKVFWFKVIWVGFLFLSALIVLVSALLTFKVIEPFAFMVPEYSTINARKNMEVHIKGKEFERIFSIGCEPIGAKSSCIAMVLCNPSRKEGWMIKSCNKSQKSIAFYKAECSYKKDGGCKIPPYRENLNKVRIVF